MSKKQPEKIQSAGKRKSAIARAILTQGKGIVRINSIPLNAYLPEFARERIREPLLIAGDLADRVDIKVSVRGGGITGQADAARLAIGKALMEFSGDAELKKKYLEYDRAILVADPRRKETRKPGRSKARAAAQKSKR